MCFVSFICASILYVTVTTMPPQLSKILATERDFSFTGLMSFLRWMNYCQTSCLRWKFQLNLSCTELQKLTVARALNKFVILHRRRWRITVFTRICYRSVFWSAVILGVALVLHFLHWPGSQSSSDLPTISWHSFLPVSLYPKIILWFP